MTAPVSPSSWSSVGLPRSRRSSLRRQRRLVLLGCAATGKSSLCTRFASDRFDDVYNPTIESSFSKTVRHRGHDVDVVITDTQGPGESESTASFRHEYSAMAHGYLLVYSITSARSLEAVRAINAKLIALIGTTSVPRVLVGTKLDLAHTSSTGHDMSEGRQVSEAEGAAVAEELCIGFTEVSARMNIGVQQAFMTLLDAVEREAQPRRFSVQQFTDDCLACCRCRRRRRHHASTASLDSGAGATGVTSDGTPVSAAMASVVGVGNSASAEEQEALSLVLTTRRRCWVVIFILLLMSLGGIGVSLFIFITWNTATSTARYDRNILASLWFGAAMVTLIAVILHSVAIRISTPSDTSSNRRSSAIMPSSQPAADQILVLHSRAPSLLRMYALTMLMLGLSEVLLFVLLLLDIPWIISHRALVCSLFAAAVVVQIISMFLAFHHSQSLRACDRISGSSNAGAGSGVVVVTGADYSAHFGSAAGLASSSYASLLDHSYR